MSKRLAPQFYKGTTRQWKMKKRREWNAVIKAFSAFRIGCAYTPVIEIEVPQIGRALMLGQIAMSQKHWKGKP